jgi:serine/threonine protein kinase
MSSPVQDQDKIDRLQKALGDTYTILNRMGGGGMGDVYMATHKTLGGKWAIKLLAEHLAEDAELVDRFMNEARIEANLQHPNIVKVVNIGQKDKFHFLIMTYVDGEDLDQRMKRERQMDVQQAVTIGLQVVGALECAHDNNIVHRDLKPSNVRIDQYGTVVVMDFGIARIRDNSSKVKTVLGQQLGTPLYMSPEQAAGRPVDARSDLYSLGVILYEMLAGSNPFEAENHYAIVMKQLTDVPRALDEVREDVPPELADIVSRLLEKDPAERYQTAAEIRQELATIGGGADLRSSQATQHAAVPEHLAKLGPLDALLHQIPGTDTERPLTDVETKLLTLIDGTKSIREIVKSAGLSETETAGAITALQTMGVVYSEIPLGVGTMTITEKPSPSRTTRRPASVLPTLTPPKTKTRSREQTKQIAPEPPKKGISMPLVGSIAAVVVIGIIAAVFLLRGPGGAAAAVQVDASPYARVVIKTDKGEFKSQDDTPFTISLTPGTYIFEFDSNGQKQSRTMKIGSDPVTVRQDFWSANQTRSLIEAYRQ